MTNVLVLPLRTRLHRSHRLQGNLYPMEGPLNKFEYQNPFSGGVANTWRSALLKALIIQVGVVGFLSLGLFGFGFGGADNPLWGYLALVLQFPGSLLFRPIATAFPDGNQSFEIACAAVPILQFILLAVVIKKTRDYWLSGSHT